MARTEVIIQANKGRMEIIPQANKSEGDTIEEGLEDAIDGVGSSNPTNRQEQRAKGPGASLLTASSGRPLRGSRQIE
uniref:Uncharacterized protein n=1 Tax=Romanomermis culicivorax TaxID=13658 RepID=A0A915KEM7_ROMCU